MFINPASKGFRVIPQVFGKKKIVEMALTILDEGVEIATRNKLNFIGDLVAATDNVLNNWVDVTISNPDLSGLVPYTGATANVNLGSKSLTTTSTVTSGGDGSTAAIFKTKAGQTTDFWLFKNPAGYNTGGIANSNGNPMMAFPFFEAKTFTQSFEADWLSFALDFYAGSMGTNLAGYNTGRGSLYVGGFTELDGFTRVIGTSADTYPAMVIQNYGTTNSLEIWDTNWNVIASIDNAGNITTTGKGTFGSVIVGNTTTPIAGEIRFDGTHFYGYNGTAWKQLDN